MAARLARTPYSAGQEKVAKGKPVDPYNSADQSMGQTRRDPTPANPYAVPETVLRDVQAEQLTLASRLRRLSAVVLDTVIIGLPLSAVMIGYDDEISAGLYRVNGPSSSFLVALGIAGLLVLALCVYQLWLLHRSGQTLGKKLLGIKIVRPDGTRAGLGRILGLRYGVPMLLSVVPYIGWLFTLIDPLFIFAEDRRCLHDRIADTIVVNV